MRSIKDKYIERDDLVFVYLTDDSSVHELWKEHNSVVIVEHYYMYNVQMKNIKNNYIKYLPIFLAFDKHGKLTEKSLLVYMRNEKLTEWIEMALKNNSYVYYS